MDWTDLAQDKENWQALVNMAVNLGFYKLCGISLLAEELLASQEELCWMQ
jgi:hypothetical protein